MKYTVLLVSSTLMFFSFCNMQTSESKLKLALQEGMKLKYPIYVEIISPKERKKVAMTGVKSEFDTILSCQKPYKIILSSEGMFTKTINYFNKSCQDSLIVFGLEPIVIE